MSLKPISPKNHRTRRVVRPAAPVVVVQKKNSSGPGGLIVGVLLLLALGGGYFVYNNQQKNAAAVAARQQQLDENARRAAEAERQKAEHERRMQQEKDAPENTLLGTARQTEDETPAPATAPVCVTPEEEAPEEETASESVLGATSAPSAGDGVFNVEDTSAPPFDLTATGKKARKVYDELDKAIDKAGDGETFHDLQADLKRSFEVASPGLFADATTLPAFPDKEQKLLRLAQGVYVCLNLAAELEARNTVPDKQHARFVNWLMKEKAKAARTFTYGLEHYNINDAATAADLLEELRSAYLVSPTTAAKKIPTILKAAAE